MGNNTGENIEGRFVLLREDWFREALRDFVKEHPEERVFLAQGGFGCNPEAMGNAVFGEFVVDGERVRIEGYQIDERFATPEEVRAALDARKTRSSEGNATMQEAFERMGAQS